ncbi:hypothetical protein U9M48_036713 [Paspalum notatum var. saurae]|uniref:Chalcone/stilbene synthase N-terminal domain-containing protein n=1 Tax=Paspalum notatum var. saurae TaxID=547442 RepID=A0AAQ3UI56_PASNO
MQSSFARDSNPSEFRRQKLTGGRACFLGVGTANPANCVQQDEYTDLYFHITKSDHLTHMKSIMKRICA